MEYRFETRSYFMTNFSLNLKTTILNNEGDIINAKIKKEQHSKKQKFTC